MSRSHKPLEELHQGPRPAVKTTKRGAGSRSGRIRTRALNIRFSENPIVLIGNDIYRVPSETVGGLYYLVNLIRRTCECPDWRKHREDCKHIVVAGERSREEVRDDDRAPCVVYCNPPYYERMRRVRTRCLYELLRCVRQWVNHG
jgi:SWIM zinc finger